MARPASKHPTELELEILKILWRDGPLPVADVRHALTDFRDLARTSVTTMLTIMLEKGYLSRRKEGSVYLYRPRLAEGATTGRMLKDVVDRAFEGSTASAVVKMLESSDLDDAEIKRIRALLDDLEGGDEA